MDVQLNKNLSAWSLQQTHGYYRGLHFLELLEPPGMEWKVVFNQDSLPSRPLHSIKSDTSSEMINRPELFLDSSLPQKKGNICFDSHRTPLYEYDFNHDFLCA